MASQALTDAESAIRWAKRQSRRIPQRTNYAQLLEDACRAAKDVGSGPIALQCPGVEARHWPCLSRLLIMDVPALIERIHPQYVRELDCPPAVAMMQLMFQDVTGHGPSVRSWKHAAEDAWQR